MKHRHSPQKVNGDVERKPLAFLLLVQQLSSLLGLILILGVNRAW